MLTPAPKDNDSTNSLSTKDRSSLAATTSTEDSRALLLLLRCAAATIDAVGVGALSVVMCVAYLNAFGIGVEGVTRENVWLFAGISFAIGFVDSITGVGLLTCIAVLLALIFWFPSLFRYPEILLISSALAFPSNVLYHCCFEASKLAGTPGKLMMGLRLQSADGLRPSVIRSLGRHAFKPISFIFAFSPIFLLWICNRHQLVHDKIVGTHVVFNRISPAAVPSKAEEQLPAVNFNTNSVSSLPSNLRYASIPRRVVASILDGSVFYSLECVLCSGLMLIIVPLIPSYRGLDGMGAAALFTLCACIVLPFAILIPMLLFSVLESGKLGATPGKIVAGIKVVNFDAGPISFFQALEKQFLQGIAYASVWPFALMFVFAACFLKCPSAELSICSAVFFYLMYGAICCATLFKGRQTLIDRLSRRVVILDVDDHALRRVAE